VEGTKEEEGEKEARKKFQRSLFATPVLATRVVIFVARCVGQGVARCAIFFQRTEQYFSLTNKGSTGVI